MCYRDGDVCCVSVGQRTLVVYGTLSSNEENKLGRRFSL